MTARILRGAAIAIALGGVADPACEVRSSERPKLAVEIVNTPSLELPGEDGGTRRDLASRVRRTLADRLANEFDVVDGPVSTAAARVVIGDAPPGSESGTWPGTFRPLTHTVNVASPLTPNVRIVRAGCPRRMTIRDSAAIVAAVEGRGLTGQEAVVRLFEDGVELASVTHRWRADADAFEARLTFLPPAAGPHHLEIRASSAAAERTELDNRVSLLIETDAVRRRVLVYQPRLSWMATFVARAIERDPRVELSSRALASRGIEVTTPGLERAGLPPSHEPSAFGHTGPLDRFDAVVVGAPDALTRAEVGVLTRYVTARGGSVILLADRRPSGPSLALSPAETYDEVLLEKAAALAPGLRASELSVARHPRAGWESLAADGTRAVLMSAPRGRGHLVFSGALDAWRYRAGSRYWQDLVVAFAARTPAAVVVQVEPAVAGPGETIEVTSDTRVARVGDETIRLWPGGEPGVFRGVFRAPAVPGMVTVAAERDGARAEATAAVDRAAAHPWPDRDAGLAAFAAAHGGTFVTANDLDPLVTALRRAAPRPATRTVRPMHSPLWIAPFATLLAAEWTLRRRRHLH